MTLNHTLFILNGPIAFRLDYKVRKSAPSVGLTSQLLFAKPTRICLPMLVTMSIMNLDNELRNEQRKKIFHLLRLYFSITVLKNR